MYRKGNTYSAPSMWDVHEDPDSFVKYRDHISVQDTPLDNRPLNFGKYRGRTPNDVYKENPGYILWMSKNLANWRELVTPQLVQHAVNRLAEIEARYEKANKPESAAAGSPAPQPAAPRTGSARRQRAALFSSRR